MPSSPTQNKRRITITVAGRSLGTFMTKEGGETDSEDLKIRPGAGEAEISLGSLPSHGNVTATALETDALFAARSFLRAHVGSGRAEIVEQPLDADNNPFGGRETYVGSLKRYAPPNSDANANEAATCELEFTIDGVG